jgi:aldehyde dehydrogenase (NAD+)
MSTRLQFYIDGAWVDPAHSSTHAVRDPATEAEVGRISLGSTADVDRAVRAARAAFPAFSESSREERLALLDRIIDALVARESAMATALTQEMGAPTRLARGAQAPAAAAHMRVARRVLADFAFELPRGRSLVRYEAIGVCGLITPWNWPLNQIACKVAPALAAGCTMVLKPSELAPFSAMLFADALHEAGVPPGVFNLVHGEGPTVGAAIAAHPDIAMVSFTGSTRAGIAVARAAADTVKRVTQELGGKSANLILDDADLDRAVTAGARAVFLNAGQSCNAPTRMLVPRARLAEAEMIARTVADRTVVGDPGAEGVHMGPLVSAPQRERVQRLINAGVAEGARLVTGGAERPAHLERGHFVAPTVFSDVRNDMTIAREEIFGPVLCLLPYDTEEEAIAIANDSPYGLAAYVSSADPARALRVSRRLRVGTVHLNAALPDYAAPFGGYKHSGNGREWGEEGMREYLEVKALFGAIMPTA